MSSHYCAAEDVRPTMTTDVLRTVFDPAAEFEGYMNTFAKFARALDGSDVSRTEQEHVWQRVMFYNYVHVPWWKIYNSSYASLQLAVSYLVV